MTDTDIEKQKLEDVSSDASEVVDADAPPAPQPVSSRMTSGDIRDPHAVVHGLDKKIEPEEVTEEDPLPWLTSMMNMLWLGLKVGFAILVVVYLIAAFVIDFERARALFVCTILVVVYQIYWQLMKQNMEAVEKAEDSLVAFLIKCDTDLKYGLGFSGVLTLIMIIIMAITVDDSRNLISLFGLFVFLGLTWLFSWKPANVTVRPVVGALFIQFIFGYIVIRTSWGLEAMEFLSDVFTTLLGYTSAGSSFVFGWLTDGYLYAVTFQLADDAGSYSLAPLFSLESSLLLFFSRPSCRSGTTFVSCHGWSGKWVSLFLMINF